MTKPKSYDDIVRQTVPLPDSSHRPTDDEKDDAEVPREPAVSSTGGGPNEATLRGAVESLEAVDHSDLQLDVDGGRATLRGSVARSDDRDRIVAALRGVPGVVAVIDQLRIRLD